MKKEHIMFISLLSIFLIAQIAYGFVPHGSNYFSVTDNTNYQMIGVIAGGGNMQLSSIGYKAAVIVGQPVIGNVSGGDYKMELGFFFGEISQNKIPITLYGTLTYDNGTAVSGSEVKVVLSYETSPGNVESYEGYDTTDSNGYFEITVYVPDYFMQYEFLLQLFVVGEVEAMYECLYCPADGTCSQYGCT